MTNQDPHVALAAMQARAENATEGPWKVRVDFPLGGGRVYESSGFPLPGCFNCGENDAVYEDVDAEFIAHARTDLPKLADALEAVLDRLSEAERQEPWQSRDTGEVYTDAAWEILIDDLRDVITENLEADHD